MPWIDDGTTKYNFVTMIGSPRGLQEQGRDITRPGVDGHERQKTGKRGRPVTIRTVSFADTAAEASLAARKYEGLAETPVTIEDDTGVEYPDQIVRRVTPRIREVGKQNSTQSGNYRIDAAWRIQCARDFT